MKLFSIPITLILFVALISGCKKNNDITYGDYDLIDPTKSYLKINFTSAYASNPDIQFAVGGKRVSSVVKTRTPYPGGGYNTNGLSFPDYLSLGAGTFNFTASIPKRGTNVDSIVLYSGDITLEAGKFATLHVADTAAATVKILTPEDMISPDSGKVKFRFINLMPNVPALDLYYGTTLVATGIAYKSISSYFTLPLPTSASAWTIRATGTSPTSTAIATYTSISTTTNARSYTAFAQGYSGATDATRRPYISFFLTK